MGLFVRLLELLAVFLPDPLTLGLFALALFNLWFMTKALHLAGTLNTENALGISLALGYLVTITINVFETLQAPARSTITTSSAPEPGVEQAGRASLSCPRNAQPVGRGGSVIES
jgi:hypothetical protein